MRRFPEKIARLGNLTAVLLVASAGGAEAAGEITYEDCVALAREAPNAARAAAEHWRAAGGGAAARHCLALAVIGTGAERRGAEMLIDIAATEPGLPAAVRAELLVEAGDLLLALGATEGAAKAATEAAKLAPRAPGPAALEARIAAERGAWRRAEAALGRAVEAGGDDAELLVLRASARLHLGDRAGARADLERAADLDPELPELWLERGRLAAAEGAREEARRAFLRAIELDRDGPVGEAARLGIQRMEAGG